jgi:hypothetical protein
MTDEQPKSPSLSPQLRCTFQTIPEETSDNHEGGTEKNPEHADSGSTATSAWFFQPEEGKKSSFVLDFADTDDTPYVAWEIPAHAVIECVLGNNNSEIAPIPFLLGGLELVSNSRNMEVYLTKTNSTNADYLMTCRGIPASQQDQQHQWHKTLSVIPGGPRSVVKVHLKLLGLRPDATTHALLKLIKVKGRLPLIEDIVKPVTTTIAASSTVVAAPIVEQSLPATAASQHVQVKEVATPPPISTDQLPQQQQQHNHPTSPFAAQPDLGMAFLAGISNMLRVTEDRMMQAINHHVTHQVQNNCQQLSNYIINNHKEMLDKQHKLARQQQRVIENQGRILQQLESRQAQLIDDVSNLQLQLQQVLQLLHDQKEEKENAIPNDQDEVEELKDPSLQDETDCEIVASNELVDEEPLPCEVQDEVPVPYFSEDTNGPDLKVQIPTDDEDMKDLLQVLECETPTAILSNAPTEATPEIQNQMWLPDANVFEQDRDDLKTTVATSPNEKDEAIQDLLQWLTSTPTAAASNVSDQFDHLLAPNSKEEGDNSSLPLWIIGEGTDDMVVIHGLLPPNSSESPPIQNGGRLPNRWTLLDEDDEPSAQQEPDSLSKVRDKLLVPPMVVDTIATTGSDHRHHPNFVHRPTASHEDDTRLMVRAASSWKGTKSEENDDPDAPKYLERPCSSF